MWVLQVDRISRVGADFHHRVGISFQHHAVVLHATSVVCSFYMIVSVCLQSDGPCGIIRGNVKRTQLPLVVIRRIEDTRKAIDHRHHLGISSVLLLTVATREFHLTKLHLETRQYLDGNLVLANQITTFRLANLNAIRAGGVIPAQDYDFLYKAGVAAIFGPGTSVAKAAVEMMKILLDKE